jgi:acyl transferase domain-containing protein
MEEPGHGTEPIAIIGIGCKFAGDARDAKGFWKLLSEGRSAWSEIPKDKFNARALYHPNPEKTGTVR